VSGNILSTSLSLSLHVGLCLYVCLSVCVCSVPTKQGNRDNGLGLGNKVNDRLRIRVRD